MISSKAFFRGVFLQKSHFWECFFSIIYFLGVADRRRGENLWKFSTRVYIISIIFAFCPAAAEVFGCRATSPPPPARRCTSSCCSSSNCRCTTTACTTTACTTISSSSSTSIISRSAWKQRCSATALTSSAAAGQQIRLEMGWIFEEKNNLQYQNNFWGPDYTKNTYIVYTFCAQSNNFTFLPCKMFNRLHTQKISKLLDNKKYI